MTKPVFRNPDIVQELPFRTWMRDHLPSGNQGVVIEDLDLVVLHFGPRIGREYDADGKFMLVEVKHQRKNMDYPQRRLFGMIHRLLRQTDPEENHYVGFYLMHWEDNFARVNGRQLSEGGLRSFLLGEDDIPSMFDEGR